MGGGRLSKGEIVNNGTSTDMGIPVWALLTRGGQMEGVYPAILLTGHVAPPVLKQNSP